MLRIGVVGYGYWGPNLVRNFSETEGVQVARVCDLSESRLAQVRARYPAVATSRDIADVTEGADVDAVVLATPVSTHYELALRALKAGKHVLVEKPMADSADKCRRLIDEAASRGRVLMVDHTFPFTGAVRKIKDMVDSGSLGTLYYYDSVRINLGLFQHDVSVIWDLAVHDLSILDFLVAERPAAVAATGMSHVPGQPANVAYLTLFYRSSMIAHINVNWLAPVKIRQTLISGSEKMIVYDDTEVTEKIKVYDKGITVKPSPDNIYQMRVGYRAGDMLAPQIPGGEALRELARHFVQCVVSGSTPITDGECGWRLVRIMEAATRSMEQRGQLVELS